MKKSYVMRTFTKRFPWAVGIGLPLIVIGALAVSFGLLPRDAVAEPSSVTLVGHETESFDISDIGRVYVLNDGMVVAQWGDFLGPDGEELDDVVPYMTVGVIAEHMDLVKSGDEWSLRGHDWALSRPIATSDATLRIVLGERPANSDGCQRQAVFQMTGILTLEPTVDGTGRLLSIEDLFGPDRFSVTLDQEPMPAGQDGPGGGQQSNSCSVTCPGSDFHQGGSCEVNNCNGIAWCFCGLIGEPHCTCIVNIFRAIFGTPLSSKPIP